DAQLIDHLVKAGDERDRFLRLISGERLGGDALANGGQAKQRAPVVVGLGERRALRLGDCRFGVKSRGPHGLVGALCVRAAFVPQLAVCWRFGAGLLARAWGLALLVLVLVLVAIKVAVVVKRRRGTLVGAWSFLFALGVLCFGLGRRLVHVAGVVVTKR